MKVTVCFNETKIVVPCGDGDISVRQLSELAIIRSRKTALFKGLKPDFIEINSLKLARDGGILDWDDKVHDVLDDKDLLIAQYSSINESTQNCSPCTNWNPSLPHHHIITPGDIITPDLPSSSCLLPVIENKTFKLPLVSMKNVPPSFGSSLNSDNFNSCSDHDIHRHFEFFDSVTHARHESLDHILDLNSPSLMLNHNSLNFDYEKWPLPPFPTISTLQSSTETAVFPKNITLQLHETNDELILDNSSYDCDEEDYARLRPDYIVKHFKNNQDKSIENSVPCRQVLRWLESQECGSLDSSGGEVRSLSFETSSDAKECKVANIAANVFGDRITNSVHDSCSSNSPGNHLNVIGEEIHYTDNLSLQLDNSVVVHLTNITTGDYHGIQIVPAYIQGNVSEQTYANNICDKEQKRIYGIEIHSIMLKNRWTKEQQLNKGDKIIQINDVNLMGMTYERGESIFCDALQRAECKLRVIPYQYPTYITGCAQPPKLNPPPPPRRSPNTELSKIRFNFGHFDHEPLIPLPQNNFKSSIVSSPQNIISACSKLHSVPPTQSNNVASCTSGFGSMVQTPTSSTLSIPIGEKKKIEKNHINVESVKTELIELTKIGSGFGFSITGGDNIHPTIPSAVFVRNILPDGAAIKDGRLKSNDRILEVDGLLLDGMSQSEVISLLREKPGGSRVKLRVERNLLHKNNPYSTSHDSLMISLLETDEEKSTLSKDKKGTVKLQFDIPLNDNTCQNGKNTLGISIKVDTKWDKCNGTHLSPKEDIPASNMVWVKTVIENGAAYRHGKLMIGDQLLEVNGKSLSGLTTDAALAKLKKIIKKEQDSEGIIKVVVLRNPNMVRSSSLNTLNSANGSGKHIFGDNQNHLHKLYNHENLENIPKSSNSYENNEHDIVPMRLMVDLPKAKTTKVLVKPAKQLTPLTFTPDTSSLEKTTKNKFIPLPPPLSKRLKKLFL